MKVCFFIVLSSGASASTWLAKMLNLSEDVFCVHVIHRTLNHYLTQNAPEEFVRNFEIPFQLAFLKSVLVETLMMFRAGGVVHSLPPEAVIIFENFLKNPEDPYIKFFEEKYGESPKITFRKALLVRNPILKVESARQLARLRFKHLKFPGTQISFKSATVTARMLGLDPNDTEDVCFSGALEVIGDIKFAGLEIPPVKVEDITADIEKFLDFFRYITDGAKEPENIERYFYQKLNRHSANSQTPEKTFEGWKRKWQKAFVDYLKASGLWEIYNKIYDLGWL